MQLKRLVCGLVLGSAVGMLAGALPAPAMAGVGAAAHPGDDTVKAVVVKSWSNCSSNHVVWRQLNAHWSAYGTIPISISYNARNLCRGRITLADLEASGADVIIISDPSGRQKRFSASEVSALRAYAEEGHEILGTFLVFAFPQDHIDNSDLAPLFGLRQDAGWSGGDRRIAPSYGLRVNKHRGPAAALYRGLPKSYVTSGYTQSQRPGDGVWSRNDMDGAKIIAANADRSSAITVYSKDGYNAVYIASMPEYGGGHQDQQFLYNAITYPRTG